MDFSPRSRRARKPPPATKSSDLYSTVVVHDKEGSSASREPESDPDIYATMVYKDDAVEDEEDSLPPLLKRLPKDFGLGGDDVGDYEDDDSGADDDEEENGGDFGTFVVKNRDDEDEEEEEEEDEGMGTMVRRGGSGGGGGGTMRRAVESMQKVGEGYGRGRKSGGGSGEGSGLGKLRQQGSGKVSSSSIPECMTREDPSTKYELLHELGKDSKVLSFTCLLKFLILAVDHG